MSDTCARCGKSPAAGYAAINDNRYCHEGPSPTCYESASRDDALGGLLQAALLLGVPVGMLAEAVATTLMSREANP